MSPIRSSGRRRSSRDADDALRKTTIDYEKVVGQVDEHEETLKKLQDDPTIVSVDAPTTAGIG